MSSRFVTHCRHHQRGGGIPPEVIAAGDTPAGKAEGIVATEVGQGVSVTLRSSDPFARWEQASVIRGAGKGTVSAVAYAALGDITASQFQSLADIQRELGADVRLSNRQNVVFRGLQEEQLRTLFDRLEAIGMARPGAELARRCGLSRCRHMQHRSDPITRFGKSHW